MKKHIFFSSLVALTLASNVVAQDFDTNPVVKYENKEQKVKFTVGARFMADAAYYHTDYTPMKSGAAITDARIRTSMTYDDWYFYADFDFSKGKFAQKNIFLQYTLKDNEFGNHSLKAGYYNDPSTMANNTSRGSLHFISRAASANALSASRQLGISYKFFNDTFFFNQGVFAENKYNDQIDGYQGVTFGGRWLYRPVNTDDNTFHVGATFRYARINTGEESDNVLQTKYNLGSSVQTYVDPFEFTSAEIPWAKNTFDVGAEALYRSKKFFARGEYMYKHVTKDRDDWTLFTNQLGGSQSWTTLESWQAANPLSSNTFHGGYVELGYQVFGNGYKYDNAEGLLKGWDGRSLEFVARYNYLGLNDIVDGEVYLPGRDQYYPNDAANPGANIKDYPAKSTSIGGGNMHSVTLGANYSFNKYAQVLLEYTWNRLDRDKYQYDKNIHMVQARLLFSF